MRDCPACGISNEYEDTTAVSADAEAVVLNLGPVCSLQCAAEMIYRLSQPCTGCPSCQPMLFQSQPEITS